MSLLQESQIQSSVYMCSFECTVRDACISMKFPCSYFVEWGTSSGKSPVSTPKHWPEQGRILFNERLGLTTEMIFNNKTAEYSRKETLVELYLASKSRPEQKKLVGRVTIDLSKIVNVEMYAQPTQFQLQFCSVKGNLTMQFRLTDQKLTSMKVHDLDRSSFIDYISQVSLKQPKTLTRVSCKDTPQQSIAERENNQPKLNKTSLEEQVRLAGSGKKIILAQQKRVILKSEIEQKGELNGLAQQSTNSLNASNFQNKKLLFGHHPQQFSSSLSPLQLKQGGPVLGRQSQDYQQPSIQQSTSKPLENDNIKHNYQSSAKALLYKLPDRLQENVLKKIERIDESESMLILKEEYESKIQKVSGQYNEQIDLKNQLIQKLSAELTSKGLICKELEESLKAVEQQCSSLVKAAEEQSMYSLQRNDNYQGQINELNHSLLDYGSRVALYEDKFTSLEQIVKNLQESNDKYHAQMASGEAARLKLADQNDKLRANKGLPESNSRNLPHLAEDELYTLRQSLAEKEEVNQLLTKKLDELLANNWELQSKIEATEEKYAQLEEDFNSFIQQFDHKREEFILLEAAHQQLRTKCEETGVRDQGGIEEVESVHSARSQKEGGKVDTHDPIEEIARLNQEIAFLRATLQVNQKQTAEQMYKLKKQNEELEHAISQFGGKGLEVELSEQDQQYPTEKRLEVQIEKYEYEINNSHDRIDAYDTLLKEERLKSSELAIQNDTICKEKSMLKQSLRDSRTEIQTLRQKMQQLIDRPVGREEIMEESWEERCQECMMRIDRLNANLEDQINQNNDLSETVIKYMEKETKMKETLTILEEESKEIFALFQEKDHNQETYQQMIEDLEREINRHKENFHQIQSECLSPGKGPYPSPRIAKPESEQRDQAIIYLQTVNAELVEEIDQLTINYQDLKAKYQALQIVKSQSEEYLKGLQTQLQTSRGLRLELEALSRDYEQKTDRSTQQILEITNKSAQSRTTQGKQQPQAGVGGREVHKSTLFSKSKEQQELKNTLSSQLFELRSAMEFVQEEKFGLLSDNNEKDIRILDLEQQILALVSRLSEHRGLAGPQINRPSLKQMYSSFLDIRDKLIASPISADWEALMKNRLDRSLEGEETEKLMSIEEKCRLLSKELQRMKAQLMKSSSKNQQEKLGFMRLIKGCENVMGELMGAVESLNTNQSSFL